jgi:hypothetical protein
LANIDHTTKRNLEKWGKRDGANPYCWMGSFKNIPLENLILEQMDESNKWKRANHNDFNVLNHEDAERFAWEAGFGRNVYLGLECCIDDIMDEAA